MGTLDLLALSPPGWGATLLAGLWNSLLIALGAFGLGLILGTLGAWGKLHGGPITRDLLAMYTTIVRAVPELILILILYFAMALIISASMRLLERRMTRGLHHRQRMIGYNNAARARLATNALQETTAIMRTGCIDALALLVGEARCKSR